MPNKQAVILNIYRFFMTDLSIKYKSVDDLIPYINNSRTHSDEQVTQVAASIKEFGFTNPILIDEQGGIIAGHGRLMAAKKLKLEQVPTITLVGLSDAQRKAYVIADNKLALNAGWDLELLKIEIDELKDLDFDIDLLGFNADELADLIPEIETLADGKEDEVPEPPVDPVTKHGDIWLLGNHRLMCGDSTMIDDVERLMQNDKALFVLTDPPYNQETNGGSKGEIGESLRKQSSDIEHLCNFEPKDTLNILPLVFAKGKMNTTLFCNKDLVPDYLNWAKEQNYSFNILVWKKPSAIPIGGSYQPDIDYCLVFRKSAKFNTRLKDVSYSKVLEHKRETGLHPTMKPVAMLENQIKIVSDEKDICLDLFGGSGGTLIACEKTKRICRMVELDPKYCDVIIKRWQDYTGKEATLESTGETYNSMVKDDG